MPELPEVETTCRGLARALTGQRLIRVEQRRPDLRFPLPPGFAERLSGRKVERIHRRAKYILIDLDDDTVLLMHLGMSGRMVIRQGRANTPPAVHDHLIFEADNGACVTFNDARRFGMADLSDKGSLQDHPWIAPLGPEPLDDGFTAKVLSDALRGKRTPIKAALLDQRIVAGLGNIYVCEALFYAGISPRRSARTIPGRRAERLLPAIKKVLHEAIAAGGSSLRDYVQTTGELGYFQHDFAVYGREGELCFAGGCSTPSQIRRIVQSGRSTFFCPGCQR